MPQSSPRPGSITVVLWLASLVGGCGGSAENDAPAADTPHPEADLRDPASCAGCHPDHYREWSGSAHAYASTSPVLRAMIQRGQRDTGGTLGGRCAGCHAPLAVQLGLTSDGTDLAEVPEWAQGITCYFCHSVLDPTDALPETVALASDGILRGPFGDATPTSAHGSAYSAFHDRTTSQSGTLCKMCHGAAYGEWAGSLFATEDNGGVLSCGQCHMPGRQGVAATGQVPVRRVHSHMSVGVDVALTPFPEKAAQRAEIQRELDNTVTGKLCVHRFGVASPIIAVTLENVSAGHNFPSCQTTDRRVWVEIVAYNADGAVVFSRGHVQDNESLATLHEDDLALFAERLFDADDQPVTMAWDAVGREIAVLPPPNSPDPLDPSFVDTHITHSWQLPKGTPEPALVTLRVRVRPIALDVLDDLIESGDLDPAIRAEMPTYTLAGATQEWTSESEVDACVP